MSEIEFDNSLEDLIQFRIFHLKESPEGKAQRNRNALGAAVGTFLVMIGLAAASGDWGPGTMVFVGLLSALAAWLSWPVTRLIARRDAARQYAAENGSRGLTGWHKLTVTRDTLEEANAARSTSTDLTGIERVRVTDDYVYIYIGLATAHVIPTDKVLTGDLAEFLTELKRRIRLAQH